MKGNHVAHSPLQTLFFNAFYQTITIFLCLTQNISAGILKNKVSRSTKKGNVPDVPAIVPLSWDCLTYLYNIIYANAMIQERWGYLRCMDVASSIYNWNLFYLYSTWLFCAGLTDWCEHSTFHLCLPATVPMLISTSWKLLGQRNQTGRRNHDTK